MTEHAIESGNACGVELESGLDPVLGGLEAREPS